jgi:hypothetical protein
MEEIGQSGVAAELLDQPRDVVAALPAACRALNPQHIEAADQGPPWPGGPLDHARGMEIAIA